MFLHLLAWIK